SAAAAAPIPVAVDATTTTAARASAAGASHGAPPPRPAPRRSAGAAPSRLDTAVVTDHAVASTRSTVTTQNHCTRYGNRIESSRTDHTAIATSWEASTACR